MLKKRSRYMDLYHADFNRENDILFTQLFIVHSGLSFFAAPNDERTPYQT